MKPSLSSQIRKAKTIEEFNTALDGCTIKVGHFGGRYVVKKGTMLGRDVSVNRLVKRLYELYQSPEMQSKPDEFQKAKEKIMSLDISGKNKLDASRFHFFKSSLTNLKKKIGSGSYNREEILKKIKNLTSYSISTSITKPRSSDSAASDLPEEPAGDDQVIPQSEQLQSREFDLAQNIGERESKENLELLGLDSESRSSDDLREDLAGDDQIISHAEQLQSREFDLAQNIGERELEGNLELLGHDSESRSSDSAASDLPEEPAGDDQVIPQSEQLQSREFDLAQNIDEREPEGNLELLGHDSESRSSDSAASDLREEPAGDDQVIPQSEQSESREFDFARDIDVNKLKETLKLLGYESESIDVSDSDLFNILKEEIVIRIIRTQSDISSEYFSVFGFRSKKLCQHFTELPEIKKELEGKIKIPQKRISDEILNELKSIQKKFKENEEKNINDTISRIGNSATLESVIHFFDFIKMRSDQELDIISSYFEKFILRGLLNENSLIDLKNDINDLDYKDLEAKYEKCYRGFVENMITPLIAKEKYYRKYDSSSKIEAGSAKEVDKVVGSSQPPKIEAQSMAATSLPLVAPPKKITTEEERRFAFKSGNFFSNKVGFAEAIVRNSIKDKLIAFCPSSDGHDIRYVLYDPASNPPFKYAYITEGERLENIYAEKLKEGFNPVNSLPNVFNLLSKYQAPTVQIWADLNLVELQYLRSRANESSLIVGEYCVIKGESQLGQVLKIQDGKAKVKFQKGSIEIDLNRLERLVDPKQQEKINAARKHAFHQSVFQGGNFIPNRSDADNLLKSSKEPVWVYSPNTIGTSIVCIYSNGDGKIKYFFVQNASNVQEVETQIPKAIKKVSEIVNLESLEMLQIGVGDKLKSLEVSYLSDNNSELKVGDYIAFQFDKNNKYEMSVAQLVSVDHSTKKVLLKASFGQISRDLDAVTKLDETKYTKSFPVTLFVANDNPKSVNFKLKGDATAVNVLKKMIKDHFKTLNREVDNIFIWHSQEELTDDSEIDNTAISSSSVSIRVELKKAG